MPLLQLLGCRVFLLFASMAFLSCSNIVTKSSDLESFEFTPLSQSAQSGSRLSCAPVELPREFTQSIVIQELPHCFPSMVTLDAIVKTSDRSDMNTVNETGATPGRYLYRTHETNEGRAGISVIDLLNGQTAVYSGEQFGGWENLDGIEWTPWGTLLVAEEAGVYGRLFECQVDGLRLTCEDRPAVGRMSHEGIAVASDGTVYLGDEFDGGSIYKFVPDHFGNLSSGQVFALNVINGGETVCSGESGVGFTPTGQGEWVALTPGSHAVVTHPADNARAAAAEAGVTKFCRPEDVEIMDGKLYVATTTTNTVYQIPLMTDQPVITEYAGINTNMNNERDIPAYGLQSPDNLASDHEGNLYIVEDNDGKSDIWVAKPDRNHDGIADSVELFGTLTTPGAEGSGLYITPTSPVTMYLNVQHAYSGNDMTLMIRRLSRE